MPLPGGPARGRVRRRARQPRVPLLRDDDGFCISADADFVITGTVHPHETKPEGPFGDHLGYYSLVHPFPVMRVHRVYHRRDAIWPFTVVGRPPQEDTSFGALIHELTGLGDPAGDPGRARGARGRRRRRAPAAARDRQRALHAVPDERGRRRSSRSPTTSSARTSSAWRSTCGSARARTIRRSTSTTSPRSSGTCSSASTRARPALLHTKTTIDTLDYSGTGLNAGSKVAIAAGAAPARAVAHGAAAHAALPAPFGGRGS
jgi:4-hydroxy-3-polyprenylbenzoate decarboxylase